MDQQNQTFDYFKNHANEWNSMAIDEEYSLIENRHNAVIEVLKKYPSNSSLLDVGCGTGQLAIQASQMGWSSLGVDFASEMIDICNQNNVAAGTNAEFRCASIFDTELDEKSFDVISAQGFIEYISMNQLDDFLSISSKMLKDNGRIALGSRNRLFNIHSYNDFTNLEVSLGTLEKIVNESVVLQNSESQERAITELSNLEYLYDQPTHHPLTGIRVETRYQFTPADLITRLAQHKLKVESIYPVHFHPLPISLLGATMAATLHKQISNLASKQLISEYRLTPYSSSFVIEARKL